MRVSDNGIALFGTGDVSVADKSAVEAFILGESAWWHPDGGLSDAGVWCLAIVDDVLFLTWEGVQHVESKLGVGAR